MDESDQDIDETDYVDVEFEETVSEPEKKYYAAAAASGLLTGMLSSFHLSEKQLKAIGTFKEKNWSPLIVKAANFAGYKKSDYKGASKYLVSKAVRVIEKNEKTKEYLTVLSKHPSLTGLLFSIITQYCGKIVVLSENGEITYRKLHDYYVIGESNEEKLICAALYWVFALAVNEMESKRRIIDNLEIPKGLRKIIKEIAHSSFIKDFPSDYKEAEKLFSNWLEKTIKRAGLYSEKKEDDGKSHPLDSIMGMVLNLTKEALPVLINEGIVRSMYVLLRVCTVIKEKKISTFAEFCEIPPEDILPEDGRILSNMCMIASALFAGANIAGAVLKGLKEKKVNGRKFAETFLAELNIVGIGRFILACAANKQYWGENIQILYQKTRKAKASTYAQSEEYFEDGDAFASLVLDAIQARILYCLEGISVQYDIAHTGKPEIAEKKKLWLETWKRYIIKGIGVQPELADQYFVEDENIIYDGIYQLAKDKKNWGWFYLLTQELALFDPYNELGCADDKKFKKLKLESNYIKDQFIRRQTIATQSEVDSIAKAYSKYKGYVSGSTRGKIIGVGVVAVASVATGGVALTFAPGIAAAIAGEAVVGLHGAALTSASLAFVGGGSLAAGGLGMAGGTAIITGGGALIGLVSSGTASTVAILLQTPSEYWVRQSAKLLTYCTCVLLDILNDKLSVKKILRQIEVTIKDTEQALNDVRAEKNDLDKDLIKRTEEYLKYLKKCQSELQKKVK